MSFCVPRSPLPTAGEPTGSDRKHGRYLYPARRSDPGRSPPAGTPRLPADQRSEEHTSELQSRPHLVCRLLLEKKNEHIIKFRLARLAVIPVPSTLFRQPVAGLPPLYCQNQSSTAHSAPHPAKPPFLHTSSTP